jgi:hypothetical protein
MTVDSNVPPHDVIPADSTIEQASTWATRHKSSHSLWVLVVAALVIFASGFLVFLLSGPRVDPSRAQENDPGSIAPATDPLREALDATIPEGDPARDSADLTTLESALGAVVAHRDAGSSIDPLIIHDALDQQQAHAGD